MIAPDLRSRWPAVALGAAIALAGFGAAALALEEPDGRATVDDMDMGLLQRNLLKIYVCGKESTIHELKLDQLRVESQFWGTPDRPKQRDMTPEQTQDLETRHKFIFNYFLAEKTSAIQMVNLVDKILGKDVHLEGEGRKERAILEKKVELIEVPKGTEITAAGRIISEALGVPVKVETVGPDIEINRIYFTMGPTTGEAILKQVCASLPKFSYRIENGTVILRHRDYVKSSAPAPGLDDEEKKALEDEKKNKK